MHLVLRNKQTPVILLIFNILKLNLIFVVIILKNKVNAAPSSRKGYFKKKEKNTTIFIISVKSFDFSVL